MIRPRRVGRGRRRYGARLVLVLLCGIGGAPADAQDASKYEGECSRCHSATIDKRHVHPPARDACDACHELTNKVEHTFSLTETGAELCYECHDEFDGKNSHAPVDSGDCTACHNPHASDTGGLLREPTVAAQCAECHDDLLEDLAFVHGPVAAGDCTACHDPHTSDHARLLVAVSPPLCLDCHEDMQDRIEDQANVHPPVRDDCVLCHLPHGAANRYMLAQEGLSLCAECHDEVAEDAEDATHGHSPVVEGIACRNCHDPHATDNTRLLRAKQMDLCLGCHNKEIGKENGTVANIGARLESSPDHHGPIRNGECVACHQPHGGERRALLARGFPDGFYTPYSEERYALCFDCHEADAFADPETDEDTEFRNGERNLHFLHVNRPLKGRSCVACHDPHASDQARHIARSASFGAWEIPIRFTLTDTGGGCVAGCHRPYRYDRDQPVANLGEAESSD